MAELLVTSRSPVVDRTEFLASMRMVPGTVAIIATADGDDRTGMAATAWASLSADPPSLLVCVNQSASANELIVRSGRFSVNVVPVDDAEIVAIFSAQRGLTGRDRFQADRWTDGPFGLPLLEGAVAAYECRVAAHHIHRTHSVFFGEVEAMVRRPDATALLHVEGNFARADRLIEI